MNTLQSNLEKIEQIAAQSGCRYLKDVSLSEYSSFKVGGNAKLIVFVNSVKAIKELFVYVNAYSVPYLVMGKGSNMLISDRGFDGVVFIIGKDFSEISLIDDTTIICESGTPLAKLCFTAYKNSLTGLEFAWGIPGNVGGGLYMNAGAYGGEINDVISFAEAIDKNGNIITFSKEELDLSYRHSIFSNNEYIITKACFKLEKTDKTNIKARMDELLKRRQDKQPLAYPSAGSTFKRPEGSYASLLIEQCGLKGLSVGGAEVSTKHSGFIINKNNATSDDIIKLINKVQKIVLKKTGYNLECEVKIVP